MDAWRAEMEERAAQRKAGQPKAAQRKARGPRPAPNTLWDHVSKQWAKAERSKPQPQPRPLATARKPKAKKHELQTKEACFIA